MGTRQETDLSNDRTNCFQITTVNAALRVENIPTNDLGLEVLENGTDLFRRIFRISDTLRQEMRLDLCLHGIDGCIAISFLRNLVCIAQLGFCKLEHLGFKLGVVLRLEFPRLLGCDFSKLDYRIDDRLETAM